MAKGKQLVPLMLMAGAVGVLLLSGEKKAKASPSPSPSPGPYPIDPSQPWGSEENPIDLDALPDEVSPGWPQPGAQAPAPAPAPLPIPLPAVVPSLPVPPAPVLVVDRGGEELAPVPPLTPVAPIVVPPRPPAGIEEQPSLVPQDTAEVVARLLSQEAQPNWKRKDAMLETWQRSRGLVADGQLGPKSALTMADEIGTIPLIRFWPKNTYPEGPWIREYQSALMTKASAAPSPRREQLRASADREQGQGFARNPTAAKQLIALETEVM